MDRQLIRQIKQESARIAETDWPIGGQKEREMIALWRQIRPRMVARLEQAGILAEFAHLIESRRFAASEANQKAGMGWPDSREEANKDWLIVDPEGPEDPSDPDGDLTPLLEMAARARVPLSVRVQAQKIRRAQAALSSRSPQTNQARP
jgi:hypothetical protein